MLASAETLIFFLAMQNYSELEMQHLTFQLEKQGQFSFSIFSTKKNHSLLNRKPVMLINAFSYSF